MRRLLAVALAFGLVVPCAAQDEKIPWTKLTLTPALPPTPALRYPLLPEYRDLKPGNAATLYQRAHSPEWFGVLRQNPDYNIYHDWLTEPLAKFPKDKARAILPRFILEEVDRAARRAYCDWELADRVRIEGLGLLVPDVQTCREYASLLRLRARLELVDGKLDKALYTLQTGFALSRHIGDAPTLIPGLVGIAIARQMQTDLLELLQQPAAPNLYWSLTDLPRSFIDLRTCIQGERLMVDALFPGVRDMLYDLNAAPVSPQQLVTSIFQVRPFVGDGGDLRLGTAFLAAQLYADGKKFLLAQGRKPKDVEAMPVVQVSLMYAMAEYDRRFDDLRKWWNAPYPEAVEAMRKSHEEICRDRNDRPAPGILADLLLPAVQKVVAARVRVDRQIAVLRCIEAIRLYAATHGGKLPTALADIREVPIPVDPATGKKFPYRVEGATAFLSAPVIPGMTVSEGNVLQFEITLRPLPARKE